MKSAIDHQCLYQITRKEWILPSGVKPKSVVFDFSSKFAFYNILLREACIVIPTV